MPTTWLASDQRYTVMPYRRCGRSGLKLPAISLGLWINFGGVDPLENCRRMLLYAFDRGITHFDLANNYGPPPGGAEETFGRVLASNLRRWRNELVISTKAGFLMWPGPYGEWGSRKHLLSSLDDSLKRMGLEYVDIFYHHRPDADTPLEETMGALASAVRGGKALYAGISNYDPARTREAVSLLREMGTPCLIHQAAYSMLNRWVEPQLLGTLDEDSVGCIAFSPLAKGMLTNRYLEGVPADSRAAKPHGFVRVEQVEHALPKVFELREIAGRRGQSIAQMAIAWVLRRQEVTSALIGSSKVEQIDDALGALRKLDFSAEELAKIDEIVGLPDKSEKD